MIKFSKTLILTAALSTTLAVALSNDLSNDLSTDFSIDYSTVTIGDPEPSNSASDKATAQHTIATLQKDWMDQLLAGQDVSHLSASYARQINNIKNTHQIAKPHHINRGNNHWQLFDQAMQQYRDDVQKLLVMDKKLAEKNWKNKVQYLRSSHQRAQGAQQQLLKHLQQQQSWLNNKAHATTSVHNRLSTKNGGLDRSDRSDRLDQLMASVSAQLPAQTAEQFGHKSLETFDTWDQWQSFLQQQHEQLAATQKATNNQQTTLHQPQKILRNSSLPYAGRSYSAPALLYEPEIIPSYANYTAAAGGNNDLIDDQIVQFSPAINQLASDLDHDYIKIVNFVRRNIKLQYYAGAMKGADATLRSYAGNDVDQAALLIALLRRAKVPARFVHGVIRQPIEQVMASVGLSQPTQVIDALNKAGIAHQVIIEGGQLRAVHRQYTWVAAYLPYANYRGSSADLSEKVWIPIAPAIKKDSYTESIYDYHNANIDADAMVLDYLQSDINQSPLQFWQAQVQADISSHYLDVDYQDLLDRHDYNTVAYPLLPSSLPFEVIVTTAESATLANDYTQTVTIGMGEDNQYLNATIAMPALSGKRLSLSYLPATVDDQNLINRAGGMANVEPYLVDLRPVLKIDGKPVSADNAPMPMGSFADLHFTFNSTAGSETFHRNTMIGNYLNLTITTQSDNFAADATDPNLFAEEPRAVRLMHNLAKLYNRHWKAAETEMAAIMDVALIKPIPALTIISPEYNVVESQGLVTAIQFKGMSIDAVTNSVDAISRGLIEDNSYDFYRLSGLQGSFLESQIFENQWAINAVSADKAINIQSQNKPLLQLTPDDYQSQLNASNHPQIVKDHITSWLQAGKYVTLMPTTGTQDSWNGSAWIVHDPDKGHSGYFISGVYAGGQTTQAPEDWTNSDLYNQLNNPYTEGSNSDPLSASLIEIINETNDQISVVNSPIDLPLSVIIRDALYNPVVNANVTFEVVTGPAKIIDPNDEDRTQTTKLIVRSDNFGVARVDAFNAEMITSGFLLLLNPNDENLTKLGLSTIKVSVDSRFGKINADSLMRVFAEPDDAHEIELTCFYRGIECKPYPRMPAGTRASVMHLRVLDQYGNFVSNKNIDISSFIGTTSNKLNTHIVSDAPSHITSHAHDNKKHAKDFNLGDFVVSGLNDFGNNPVFDSYDQLMFVELDDDSQPSLFPPENADSSLEIISNYFHTTFEVYTPDRPSQGAYNITPQGEIPLDDPSTGFVHPCNLEENAGEGCGHAYDIKIESSGLEDVITSVGVALPIFGLNRHNNNYHDYVTGHFNSDEPGTDGEWRNINNSMKYAYHYFGPYGPYQAGSPGEQIFLKARFFINHSITNGSEYQLDKFPSVRHGVNFVNDQAIIWSQPAIINIDEDQNPSEFEISINESDFDVLKFDVPNTVGMHTYSANIAYPDFANRNSKSTGGTLDIPWIFNDADFDIYSAKVSITGITPEDFSTSSGATEPLKIFTLIEPADYRPQSILLKLYEDGEVIFQSEGKNPGGPDTIFEYNNSGALNEGADYEFEVTLNADTEFEIKSDRVPVEGLSPRIVTRVTCSNNNGLFSGSACGGPVINNQISAPLKLLSSIEISDVLVCRDENLDINLNSDAHLLIRLEKLSTLGEPIEEPITIADDNFVAGQNTINITADELGNGRFKVRIIATSAEFGTQEITSGQLDSVYQISDSLLVGHPIVKGVDLADGSMIYSKKDISLPAPGSDLEFIRTYTIKNRYELGPLGFGWSHNYMSRVILSNCGRIYVTGADGGVARFRLSNESIVPMLGNHSELIANEDGSFSYYTKNGTHYHYTKRQDKVWWLDFIEDTNNNRLSIELQRNSGVSIVKSVTDSNNRKLQFNYDLKTFDNYIGPVLTQVTGPERIQLNFEYSSDGHLISAKREGETTDESYQYINTSLNNNVHLLERIKDNASSAIRTYSYKDNLTFIPEGIQTNPSIIEKVVDSIDESDGGRTTFTYNNLIGSNNIGFNQKVNVSINGQLTTYHLNDHGAAHSIVAPKGTKNMVWRIDDEVLLISETDENGRTKTFEYDANANITKESIGDIFRAYTYDPPQTQAPFIKDRVASYTNWRGITTTYTNDSKGNKTAEDIGGVQTAYTYNSRGLVIGVNDFRNNDSILQYDALGQLISQTNAAGNQSQMTWDRRGRKTSETDASGNRTNFVYDNSDRIISKTLNDRVWTYSYQQGGLIKTETDPNGNATVYSYDTMGRLLNIKNADEQNFSYSYDENGNKLSENDFNGNQTSYIYDNANRLITKTEPLGKITTYTYDNVGNVLTESTADRQARYAYDPNRYFLTAFTGEGAPEQGSNKADKMLVSAQTVRTVDGEGNILTETDPNGNLTGFEYDAFNRVTKETGVLGSGRDISYDGNGNIITEIIYNSSGNQTRSYTYDGANRRISMVDAKGNSSSFSYFGNGNLKSEINPQSKQATYEYNDLNLVTNKTEAGEIDEPATWAFEYDAAGNLITEDLPNGNVITTTYDALNRPLIKSDQIGAISTFTYDANSNITSETDGNGNQTTHTYNGLNQRITSSMPLQRGHSFTYTVFGELLSDTGPNGTINYDVNVLGQRTSATGPDGYSERYDYDANDNLTAFTDSRGTLTVYGINALNQTTSQTTGDTFNKAFTFDTLGNKLTETDYRGIQSTFTYDAENLQTSFTRAGQLQNTTQYNSAGLAQSETDANGNTRVHLYNRQYYRTQTTLPETQVIKYLPDEFGDVTMQDNPGANDISRVFDQRRRLVSETNGAGEQTRYEYDLNNNRTAVIKPNGARWEYIYDAANRLTAITNINEAINTSYEYDNRDNLTKMTDAEGKVTSFTFDNRNRKLSKIYPDGQVVNYGYDNNGNLTSMSLPNGSSMTYQYDILNRKISESYSGSYGSGSVTYTLDGNGNTTQIEETIDGETFTTTQSFDDLDRMISRTDAQGHSFGYQYDANGNRTNFVDHNNAITNYSYDGLNRLTQLTFAGLGTFSWDYNAAGLVNNIDYPNNTSVNYLYDNANRIKQINYKLMTADISSHEYSYDANGNRISLTQSNINNNLVINYEYDRADRLTKEIYPNQTTEYVLDKVGNRISEVLTGDVTNSKTYSYNNRDQLTNIVDTQGLNVDYTYDNAGNQLTKDENGVITTFNYTPRHRVKTITVGGAPPANYTYDYTGQRIRYRGNGEEKRYLYDGLTLIGQTNVLGSTIARYHYGDRYQLAETRHGRTNSYYHVDSLGTNVAITTVNGTIAARYEYDAYGNIIAESGASDQPFGFTGYQKDQETGLLYANARYYDSSNGRFLREDPFDGDVNVPPSLHRYLYAFANPGLYTDPTGKCNEASNGFSFAGCIDHAEHFGSFEDPEAEILKSIEIEGAGYTGIALAGIDAVKGTFEVLGQFSATLGEGLSGGYYYSGSAREFRNTLFAMGNGIAHPLDTIEKSYLNHQAKVLAFEEAGDRVSSSKEKFRFGTNWVVGVVSVAKGIQSVARNKPHTVAESRDNKLNLAEVDRINNVKIQVINAGSIEKQIEFLTKNINGLSAEQARKVLEIGFKNESSVVFGGSRVRGDFKPDSDLDVGFGNIPPNKAQKIMRKLNKQKTTNDLLLEDQIAIVPGKKTENIPEIISPEEFFQRNGQRSSKDSKSGENFNASGSITVTEDGRIIITPIGAEL